MKNINCFNQSPPIAFAWVGSLHYMMDDDYDIEYGGQCPQCGHSPLHSRSCTNFCNEGYHDKADNDPINFMPGEELTACEECKGTGLERWCPGCGANLSGVAIEWDEDPYEEPYRQKEIDPE